VQVRAAPGDSDALCNLAQFMHGARGRLRAAEKLYGAALDADPEHVRALCNLGVLRGRERGAPEEARALFARALDADPACEDAREGFMRYPPGHGPARRRAARRRAGCRARVVRVACAVV